MRKTASKPESSPEEIRGAIETFLASARRPALLEPGQAMMPIDSDHFCCQSFPAHVSLQAWDEKRNLVRRVRSIEKSERGKLSLSVVRFAGRAGELQLVDLAHPRIEEWERRGARHVFRERFRRMLEREFTGWRVSEISTEASLEHSLSPAYPRALLTRGVNAIAAIAAPPECSDFPSMLSFGLIWLDYLRRRDPERGLHALTFWAPSPVAPMLSFYLPLLDPASARFAMYLYSDDDFAAILDPEDYGNVSTEMEPCRYPAPPSAPVDHTEHIPRNDGSISLRVAGLEFARSRDGQLIGATPAEAHANARSLHALRNPSADRGSLIYTQNPEAWLESVVRANLPTIDASLLTSPLYGQVPAIAGAHRTVIDLLAVDRHGRLAVLELKASQDIHLPLQALDYWLRVQWHLERGDFSRFGYFPGIELRNQPPRLLLIAPSLDFHPATETILRYLRPDIEVVRVGLAANWRETVKVMFRLHGAERPHA